MKKAEKTGTSAIQNCGRTKSIFFNKRADGIQSSGALIAQQRSFTFLFFFFKYRPHNWHKDIGEIINSLFNRNVIIGFVNTR